MKTSNLFTTFVVLCLSSFTLPALAQAEGQPSALVGFLPLFAIVIVFYFLIIRPQHKKQKQIRQMIAELKNGDEVITASGIYGVVGNMKETHLSLKVNESTTLTIQKHAISQVLPKGTIKNL